MSNSRLYVSNLYKTKGWAAKVAQMSDEQVHAIYIRHIHRPEAPPPSIPDVVVPPEPIPMQMHLDI